MQENKTDSPLTSEETIIEKVKGFVKLLINAGNGFAEDNCMKLSASLAYYTVFSIGPLVIILIWLLGFLYGNHLEGQDGAKMQVLNEISNLFGEQTTALLDGAIQKISAQGKSSIGLIIGIGSLVFTSTTIFVDIQNSINTIWQVKAKPKKGWLKMLANRLISFSMILGLSFLLIASLLISSIIGIITQNIEAVLERLNIDLNLQQIENWGLINTGITFTVIACLFGFIFAFLPDAKVRFKDILGGAIFTAILFMIGKYGISMYLSTNATASAYGAAGSIIILLAWVYYSAAILYFGAEFTKEYAIKYGRGIHPTSFAVLVKQTELEIDPETGTRKVVHKHNEPIK